MKTGPNDALQHFIWAISMYFICLFHVLYILTNFLLIIIRYEEGMGGWQQQKRTQTTAGHVVWALGIYIYKYLVVYKYIRLCIIIIVV